MLGMCEGKRPIRTQWRRGQKPRETRDVCAYVWRIRTIPKYGFVSYA